MMPRLLLSIAAVLSTTSQIEAATVDLNTWSKEGSPSIWRVEDDGNSVLQVYNGPPTVYTNGTPSQGSRLTGNISVEKVNDDDFIGFVIGYNSGDLTSANANYLLIDWKQADQGGFLGGQAFDGLSISRVTGPLEDNRGAWLHDPAFFVEELQRATTLGSTGWIDKQVYAFDLTFTAGLVEFWVDGTKEISLEGNFSDGALGLYVYTQSYVRFANIEQTPLPQVPSVIPLPASLPAIASGLGCLGLLGMRRKKRRPAPAGADFA